MIPLFHAAWLFALGIALAHWAWLRPGVLLVALAATAMACGAAAWRAQRVRWVALAAVWCLLGAWCAEMEPHAAASASIANLSDGLSRTLEGTVTAAAAVREATVVSVDEPSREGPSQRVDVRVDSLEVVTDSEDAQQPAPGGVRLTMHWEPGAHPEPFKCGEKIRVDARLMLPEVYRDAGVWSRADYLLDQGITATSSVKAEGVKRVGAEAATFACRTAALQQAATTRLRALPAAMQAWPSMLRLSGDDTAMLAAMTAGDRTYLTHTLRAGFERTGSFHMLVVSGFHLAIVAGCLFWLARAARLPRVPATLVTLAASSVYALFTGFAVPVQRSLWMVAVFLLGRLMYRERSPLNVIGFASLCLLAASPHTLFDAGLQMTLLAVVSIAGVAAPLLERTVQPYLRATRELRLVALDMHLEPKIAEFRVILRMLAWRMERALWRGAGWRQFPWLLRFTLRLVELVTVSCMVELAMTLPMALYFHRITLTALPVNMLILPLLAVLMPMALATLALATLWPAAAAIPAAGTALLLHAGVGMVHFFGSLTLGDWRIPDPRLGQCVAFCALLGAAMVLARGGRWPRRAAWAAMMLAAGAAVLPRAVTRPHDAMLVEAIDVGQGDSLLVIAPDGASMLMDGGGFGGGPRQATQDFDIGEEVVSPALWARGLRRLDVVALSHAHSDHMSGLTAVLRNFRPRELWVGENPAVAEYTALLNEARALGVKVRVMHAGDAAALGNVQVRALAPMPDYRPGEAPVNNDSLVLHVQYGATSVLLEGDAEAPVEQAMLAEAGLESTLLKVGHHGSRSSTTPAFLARVHPEWAVISCGLHNRYQHPRAEVLRELEDAHVRTLSTDIDGASCFELDGRTTRGMPFCGRDGLH